MPAYHLPHSVRDQLGAALAGRRNRDAVLTLATFIGRFWSSPNRLAQPYVLDRRALSRVASLGLTEARIRGALQTLERVGFLDRAVTGGRTHQRTPDGLRRRPIRYRIGTAFRALFDTANRRAQAARGRRSAERRSSPRLPAQSPSVAILGRSSISPRHCSASLPLSLGEHRPEPDPRLEAALDRLRSAVTGKQRVW